MIQSNKTLYILVGARGAGKSHVGTLIEKEFGVPFLNVEPFFIAVNPEGNAEDGDAFVRAWHNVSREIASILSNHTAVTVESIGIFDSYFDFVENMKALYTVVTIFVETDKGLCDERVFARDCGAHVPATQESLNAYYQMLKKTNARHDLIIQNNDCDEDLLIKQLEPLFGPA